MHVTFMQGEESILLFSSKTKGHPRQDEIGLEGGMPFYNQWRGHSHLPAPPPQPISNDLGGLKE